MQSDALILDALRTPIGRYRGALSRVRADDLPVTVPDPHTEAMGETGENVAEGHGISREDQDQFALRSHQLANAAWDDGHFQGPGAK